MHVVIVGGGPAGAVAAVTLAGRGHDITVIESNREPSRKVGECLSPGANEMLRTLGLFDGMETAGHLPSLGNRSCWGSSAPAERDFFFGMKGEGWHLDRRRFESDLARIAVAAGVEWLTNHRLRAFRRDRARWQLTVESPNGAPDLKPHFVIDASGRSRLIARKLSPVHAKVLPKDEPDRLLGLVGIFAAPEKRERNRKGLRDRFTEVEAIENGWWYSALLGDGSLVAVAMTDADLLPKRESWNTLLAPAKHTRRRIERHGERLEDAPVARNAGGSRLERAHGDGWLAAGDAALAFDPLSSYGITSAMGTGFYAAHAAADTMAGDPSALHGYQALLDHSWEDYLRQHAEHYALETRWPESLFWSRRIAERAES